MPTMLIIFDHVFLMLLLLVALFCGAFLRIPPPATADSKKQVQVV